MDGKKKQKQNHLKKCIFFQYTPTHKWHAKKKNHWTSPNIISKTTSTVFFHFHIFITRIYKEFSLCPLHTFKQFLHFLFSCIRRIKRRQRTANKSESLRFTLYPFSCMLTSYLTNFFFFRVCLCVCLCVCLYMDNKKIE